ncbi:MAG: hypothetical protein IK102_09655 [Treponema sp.]|nr:hypothetical protein [Treponema sp.]
MAFFSIVLASCENFFKGADTKEQLERALAYANASTYAITIDYPEGTGVLKSPAGGVAEKKETDIFTLCFEPFTDYAFVCWKIIDGITGKEIKNGDYLTLQELDKAETLCTFNKMPGDNIKLKLQVQVVERPQIISYSPTTTNALKDSSIQVLFDREIDPHSIYYTDQELQKLRADKEVSQLLQVEGTKNYYGYIKNGEIIYKNITITNKKTKANILENFSYPTMEEGLLTIYANKTNPPDDYLQILVNIGKDFFYSIPLEGHKDGKIIPMSGSKKWMYQVSNTGDSFPLIIKVNGVTEMLTAKLGNKDLKSGTAVFDRQGDHGMWISKTNLQNMGWNHIGTNLYLKFTVQEAQLGSGPAPNFKVKIEYIANDAYYQTSGSNKTTYEIPLEYDMVTSQEASYEGTINLAEYNVDLSKQGVYCLSLICPDNCNNELTKTYLFANDNNVPTPHIRDLILTINKSLSSDRYTFRWPKPDLGDLKTITFYKKNNSGTTPYSSEIKEEGSYYLITVPLETGKNELYVKNEDYCGHTKESEHLFFHTNALNRNKQITTDGNKMFFGNYPNSSAASITTNNLYELEIYDYDMTKSADDDGYYHSFIFREVLYFYTTGYAFKKTDEGKYFRVESVEWKKFTRGSSDYWVTDWIYDKNSISKGTLFSNKQLDEIKNYEDSLSSATFFVADNARVRTATAFANDSGVVDETNGHACWEIKDTSKIVNSFGEIIDNPTTEQKKGAGTLQGLRLK